MYFRAEIWGILVGISIIFLCVLLKYACVYKSNDIHNYVVDHSTLINGWMETTNIFWFNVC